MDKSLERIDRLTLVKQADSLLPSPEVINNLKEQARALLAAKMLPPGYKTEADVFIVALFGREMGVSFGRTLRGMFPMKGRIGFMGNFGLGLVEERCPGSTFTPTNWTADTCTVQTHRGSWKPDRFEEVTFTLAEAKAAGWTSAPKYEKDTGKYIGMEEKAPWKNPKVQLYWRCVGFLLRAYYDDIFGGAFYTADEIQDISHDDVPSETGPVIGVGAPYKTAAQAAKEKEEAERKSKPDDLSRLATETLKKSKEVMLEGKGPGKVIDVLAEGLMKVAAASEPLPPDYDEEGRRIDAQGNLIPEDAVVQPEIEFGGPAVAPPYEIRGGLTPSTNETVSPDPDQIDEDRVRKFVAQAANCKDRKSLDVLHEDYKRGSNPKTLGKIFRSKQDRIAQLAAPTQAPKKY